MNTVTDVTTAIAAAVTALGAQDWGNVARIDGTPDGKVYRFTFHRVGTPEVVVFNQRGSWVVLTTFVGGAFGVASAATHYEALAAQAELKGALGLATDIRVVVEAAVAAARECDGKASSDYDDVSALLAKAIPLARAAAALDTED